MTTTTDDRPTERPIRWRARADGNAHAYRNGERNRALCGALQLLERDAWPTKTRCWPCQQILGADS